MDVELMLTKIPQVKFQIGSIINMNLFFGLPDPGLPYPVQISLLSNLGVSENGIFLMHSLHWSNESLVTLIEELGEDNQIVICDLEKKKKITNRIDADHAVVNSTYTFTAFSNIN
jgi:hypothetical protein